MSWSTTRKVEFSHVDGAGIVFYPRYFEMISSVIEEWFDRCLDYPFDRMHFHDRRGIPTAEINVKFMAPSRLGDVLEFSVHVTRLGNSSADVETTCRLGAQTRLIARQTLVRIDLDTGRPEPWPERMRARMIGGKDAT
ncbi:MAG: thioesterase family protein [Paracoccaceae bacterium]|nr:thioesterase family protein [Paracoccaceae bacterium]